MSIALNHITLSYGSRTLLEDVTAAFAQGSLTALIGRNGTGKSTLLRCLNGLEPVQAGRVKLGSETVAYGGKNLAALRQRILLFCRIRLCCIRQCRSCWQ